MNIKIDYYEVLGVIPNAEPEVIKAAYRALVNIYHPDRNDSAKAKERIREINIAYEVLADKKKRADYDKQREDFDNNATASSFESNVPFNDDNTERDWKVATEFYPSLIYYYNELTKISWRLGFAYKLNMLESKNYSKEGSIADKMKSSYLSTYFGKNNEILEFAEILIKGKFIEAALELNIIIKVIGNTYIETIKNKLFNKFPDLEAKFTPYNFYSKIKNDYNDYKYAISLIEYYGGKVKEPLFGYKFKVRFDGKKFVIDGFIELCEFALKTYEDKFNS